VGDVPVTRNSAPFTPFGQEHAPSRPSGCVHDRQHLPGVRLNASPFASVGTTLTPRRAVPPIATRGSGNVPSNSRPWSASPSPSTVSRNPEMAFVACPIVTAGWVLPGLARRRPAGRQDGADDPGVVRLDRQDAGRGLQDVALEISRAAPLYAVTPTSSKM
jgi:hypothetical protein